MRSARARPEIGLRLSAAVEQTERIHSYIASTNVRERLSERTSNVKRHLEKCSRALEIERLCCWQLIESNMVTNEHNLMKIERKLLNSAAYLHCTAGIFYALSFRFSCSEQLSNIAYTRFFESGIFNGFMKHTGEPKLLEEISDTFGDCQLFCNRVFTVDDIYTTRMKQYPDDRSRKSRENPTVTEDKRKNRHRPDTIYKTNQKDICSHLQCICSKSLISDNVEILTCVLYLVRDGASNFWLNCLGKSKENETEWGELFKQHQLTLPDPNYRLFDSLYQNSPGQLSFTLMEQADIINCISNNHFKTTTGKAAYEQYFVITLNQKYPPTSPRNRLAFFWNKDDISKVDNIIHLLLPINNVDVCDYEENGSYHTSPLPKRIRRNASRVSTTVHLTNVNLQQALQSAGYNSIPEQYLVNDNEQNQGWTLYDKYKSTLLDQGLVHWRISSPEIELLVMNDYDPKNGIFLPNNFVHVERLILSSGMIYKCSCRIYGCLHSMALSSSNFYCNFSGLQCMHCRMLKEILEFQPNNEIPSSGMRRLLASAKLSINMPIVILGQIPSTAVSVSVLSKTEKTCKFVRLYAEGKFIVCQSAYCSSIMGSKKSLQRLVTCDDLCEHLDSMKANKEQWECFFNSAEETPEDLNEVLEDGEVVCRDTADPSNFLLNTEERSFQVPLV